METQVTCGNCGTPLTNGLCPRCLLDVGLSPEPDEVPTRPDTTSPLARLGDYELLEEIGRGGMGIVYRARQVSLDRIVAVKLLPFGGLGGPDVALRLRAEAVAAGSLRHPNIVAIHEVGLHQGHHFLAMDFVAGPSLAHVLRDGPLAAKSAATLLRQVALAVQHAHERGIIHRDLKPSNILLDSTDEEPRVTDFGLAKNLRSDTQLTLTGQTLGSPNYIPPEQIRGFTKEPAIPTQTSDIDGEATTFVSEAPRSGERRRRPAQSKVSFATDVYALGATLYHALTGRPPFIADGILALLDQVLNSQPLSLRQLNASIPADLETICLKCLEKEPAKRYPTARELGEELGRFLNNESIHAVPASTVERVWRWCRRKPALATLGGIALALVFIVVIGAPVALVQINRKKVEAERNLYSADMKFASEALRDGAVARAEDLLRRHEHGKAGLGVEWRCLWHELMQRKPIRALSGLPAKEWHYTRLQRVGDTLYNVEWIRGQIRAWDMKTWEPLPLTAPPPTESLIWSWQPANETAFAVNNSNRTVQLYQLPSLKKGLALRLAGTPSHPVMSGDRQTIAVCSQEGKAQRVVLWDAVRGTERGVIGRYTNDVLRLLFAPDSSVLAVVCIDGLIDLWDVASLRRLPGPLNVRSGLSDDFAMVFAIHSHRLFFGDTWKAAELHGWDWENRESTILPQGDVGMLTEFGIFAKGETETLVTIWGDVALLQDAKTLQRISLLRGHPGGIVAFAFSPDGTLVATGSFDHSAKLWVVSTGRELATLGGHTDIVSDVVFSADGRMLVTTGAEGKVRVWDVAAAVNGNVLIRNPKPSWRFSLSSNERTLAALDATGTVHVWDRLSRAEIHTIHIEEPENLTDLAFAPNGRFLAWIGRNTVRMFDLESGKSNVIADQRLSEFRSIAFSPDGREIAFTGHAEVALCDLETGTLRPFASLTEDIFALSYSPDGALLAFGHDHGGVSLWHRQSGRRISWYPGAHVRLTSCVTFSADGKRLATCGSQTINLWRVRPQGLDLQKTLTAHVGYMPAVAFSPDGTRLVSASSDHTLKLWSTADGIEVGTLYGHQAGVSDVLFSKDGNTIFSNGQDGTIRIWEASLSEQPIRKAGTATP